LYSGKQPREQYGGKNVLYVVRHNGKLMLDAHGGSVYVAEERNPAFVGLGNFIDDSRNLRSEKALFDNVRHPYLQG